MNRRRNLCDNPYAKTWIMPGMILLHEDPLSFVIDQNAASIALGEPLEEPVWAILTPNPKAATQSSLRRPRRTCPTPPSSTAR